MPAPTITTRARAYLRSLAHGLRPVVQVGGEGLSEAVVRATSAALVEHELIKIKLGQAFEGDRKQAAQELAQATESALCQVIGRVIVLYRPRPAKHPRNRAQPRITLPG